MPWLQCLCHAYVVYTAADVVALSDAQWLHSLLCKQACSHVERQKAINDVIAHAIT